MTTQIWHPTTAEEAFNRHRDMNHVANGGPEYWMECPIPACHAARECLGVGHPSCPTCRREYEHNGNVYRVPEPVVPLNLDDYPALAKVWDNDEDAAAYDGLI